MVVREKRSIRAKERDDHVDDSARARRRSRALPALIDAQRGRGRNEAAQLAVLGLDGPPASLASARVSSGGSCTHASIHASTYQTLKALQQYRVLGDVLRGHLADRVEDHAMQLGQPAAAGAAAAAGALAALAGALPPRAAASASRLAFLAARLEGWPSVGFAPDPAAEDEDPPSSPSEALRGGRWSDAQTAASWRSPPAWARRNRRGGPGSGPS